MFETGQLQPFQEDLCSTDGDAGMYVVMGTADITTTKNKSGFRERVTKRLIMNSPHKQTNQSHIIFILVLGI